VTELFKFKNLEEVESILLDPEQPNPFPAPPAAVNFHNNPPQFICGRAEEIQIIKKEIRNSIKFKEPKLIKVFGKQGIGKSTLVCWVYKEIMENSEIIHPMVFLNASGQPEGFHFVNFYCQIFSQLEQDQVLEKLAYHSITRFIQLLIEKGGKLENSVFKDTPITNDILDKIKKDPNELKSFLADQGTLVIKIIDLYKKVINFIRADIPVNPEFLVTLWNAFSFTARAFDALNAIKGIGEFEGFHVRIASDAKQAFIDFINLCRWSFGDVSVIIVIDHLESCTNENKSDNFSNLFSLLLELRQLTHLCIILSGTMDAFVALDEVLQEDQKLQLDNWSRMITLSSLEPELVVDVIKAYLSRFWSQQNHEPPHEYSFFPFGPNSLMYLYDTTNKDLRRTLIRLHEIINSFRKKQEIEGVESFFDGMRKFRTRKDITLTVLEQKYFVEEILKSETQDKERSTKVEMAVFNLFKIAKSKYEFISDVKHEPKIKKLKPDVFVELFGNLGLDKIRKLVFEVKIYRKGDEIPKSEVTKTLSLLNDHLVDYVHWVTNKPLSLAKYNLNVNLHEYLGRTKPLEHRELAYASLVTHFNEIFGREPTPDEAIELLEKIGIDILTISEEVKARSSLSVVKKKPKRIPTLIDFKPSEPTGIEQGIAVKKPVPPPVPTPVITSKKQVPVQVIETDKNEIASKIKKVIKKHSNKTRVYIKTVFKDLSEKQGLRVKEDEKDDVFQVIHQVVNELGYRMTASTISFK